ncbi:MAG: sigma-54 dependent transcriptional regulator [Cytophagales bacterium]|nr:sigma-54 dependent transcriptional regulator [Cytophagales bacterium]
MSKGSILIVDDNEEFLIALKLMLTPHFREVVTENSPETIISQLQKRSFDLILLDMNFKAGINTGNEGLFWLNKIKAVDQDATIVFITAYGDVQLAVKSVKEGAADFIQKSWDEKKILSTLLSAYQLSESKSEIKRLKSKQQHLSASIDGGYQLCKGPAPSMEKIYATIEKVAETGANVLITGENGTGKEVIAREIHRLSGRGREIFVSVDISALNENLIESELFGHKKGAFTDAKADRTGRFELASGGTLFLDEIGNLSLASQAKLLTVLQTRRITKVGDNKPLDVDVRLICATNIPVARTIAEGSFREDLLYRINTIHLELPALRNRKEDIPVLAHHFLNKLKVKYKKPSIDFKKTSMNQLLRHDWPGNIRELGHTIEKAVIMTTDNFIKPEDLMFELVEKSIDSAVDSFNLMQHEKMLIDKALKKFGGNMSRTARELGINRSTLYEKIRKHEL